MGLDRDDTIIRRRLRQKMEFLPQDLVEQAEPTEVELQTYLGEQSLSSGGGGSQDQGISFADGRKSHEAIRPLTTFITESIK